jgi:hypothetical protein
MIYLGIAAAVLYLIPGFILLARRPEGRNLSGEAVFTTLLWPLFIGTGKAKDTEDF